MKDELGDRMKSFYENRTRIYLPRRTYTLIRIDGKAFHTYTKGLERPFDTNLIEDMDNTAKYLCENIMGAKFAFVQSDEISILITDFDKIMSQAWFDNNLQKMCSISASLATVKFNQLRWNKESPNFNKIATFDSRVFQISSKTEVMNYFIFRQQDCVRNSIQSVAQSLYSEKELHGKNQSNLQEMIFQKGINWNNFDPKLKRGRIILKENFEQNNAIRTRWISNECPTFVENTEFLTNLIPTLI